MKEQLRENKTPKRIGHIRFTRFSADEIRRLSNIHVVAHDLYQLPRRGPFPYGPLDRRLGPSDKNDVCDTCGKKLSEGCEGHFGHITLELPVFHIGYIKAIYTILQKICKTCGRVLLADDEIAMFARRYATKDATTLVLNKLVTDRCKRMTSCIRCHAINGPIKKVVPFKFLHERNKSDRGDYPAFRHTYDVACEAMPTLDQLLLQDKAQDDLTPLRVYNLFQLIPASDCAVLDIDVTAGRPETLLIKDLLVPPGPIRPSVAVDTGINNEDDLTMLLVDIVKINTELKNAFENGEHMSRVYELWEQLQLKAALYIHSEIRLPPSLKMPTKTYRGFSQRLKGKQGRFRGNLSGKRVDFSGRTVISPDPNLRIDQVGVPMHMAKILTYPEKVNRYNLEWLQRLVRNGPDVYPGATHVEKISNNQKRFLKYTKRDEVAASLRFGDIVERHLMDGDVVLFNRQPSLHKLSIMCHQVRVLPWRTLRFNECVCTPYNADFDGDEMNIHVPQTETAKAEALVLMGTKSNICTPRNGAPLIAATQDFLTGAYVLSLKNTFFCRAQFCQLATYLTTGTTRVTLPPPCVIKPVEMWSGKQLLSLLLACPQDPETGKMGAPINLECANKSYSNNKVAKNEAAKALYGMPVLTMCPDDGYCIIRNSELLCGVLDKGILGSGTKSTIFYVLLRTRSEQAAADAMVALARVASFFLQNRGFSIGVGDVRPDEKLLRSREDLVRAAYTRCATYVEQRNNGTMEAKSGSNLDETLESKITSELNQLREECGKLLYLMLPLSNPPLIMARCGSKGSDTNLSQMIACVGQQVVNGARIPNGFDGRSLPHFPRNSRLPAAKGFVLNSFFTGLTPTEFFFHTMGGREGLVDSAVKTADTGYMQRRLMKALEDLSTHYDMSVRTSVGSVIQFRYGDDGLDPVEMEGDDVPINWEQTFIHVTHAFPCPDEPGLLPFEIEQTTNDIITSPDFSFFVRQRAEGQTEHHFLGEIRKFLTAKASALADLRARQGLPPCRISADEPAPFSARVVDGEVALTVVTQAFRLSSGQLQRFCRLVCDKYQRACIEAGTAVGAVCAQSLGEPTTQMTLKTFHHSGIAGMNITQGVPRVKEIINAVKNTSTPVITAPLESTNPTAARIVKGRIERTLLGEVVESIEEVLAPKTCCLIVRLDVELIKRLQLEVDMYSVADAIVERSGKLKLKRMHVVVLPGSQGYLRITPNVQQGKGPARPSMLFALHQLKAELPHIAIKGLDRISRAVVQKEEGKAEGGLKLMAEGDNLLHVMGVQGVVGTKVRSNHILDVERTLGIEAARASIISEVVATVKPFGVSIDWRHLSVLSDLMTTKGEVLGITRFGIAKMNDRVLMLASFEKTNDILFDAAIRGRRDDIYGVSECIIMGVPISLGTGLFKLLRRADQAPPPPQRALIFDRPAPRA